MNNSSRTPFGLLLAAVLLAAVFGGVSCKRSKGPTEAPAQAPKEPSLRLFVASTLAGAMEPCGCRKDMLGGVDHAAALIDKAKEEAPNAVVVGAGPMFFLNPQLTDEKRQQDLWKAHGIAKALRDMKLAAWAPGLNDLAAGTAELAKLRAESGAALISANAAIEGVDVQPARIVDAGDVKLGLAGVTKLPKAPGLELKGAKSALVAAKQKLQADGAKVLVALVAAPRGDALRLAEAVTGFHVMVVGKPSDRGEGNDAPTPPVFVGQTLVVEAPNHLQALAVVDLFIRGDELSFGDGSGIREAEQRASLERRIEELQRRIDKWKRSGKVSAKDLAARQADLEAKKKKLADLSKPGKPPTGSYFTYALRDVRERLGSNEQVLSRMRGYYKQVNEYNKLTFKNRKPAPVAEGKPTYVGGEACIECHEEAYAFWKTTGHAKAYETLEVDFKEFNLDCVSCHVTGYEKPGGSTVTFVENLKDVQCEECHGPGSIHVKEEDSDYITLTPAKTLCSKCHHPPHVADDWDVEQAWPHILGEGHGGEAQTKSDQGVGGNSNVAPPTGPTPVPAPTGTSG
jgi:hypothetical protein